MMASPVRSSAYVARIAEKTDTLDLANLGKFECA